MSRNRIEELRERVDKFHRLELPGQPLGMHMGTSYLVSDLLSEIEALSAALTRAERDAVIEECEKAAREALRQFMESRDSYVMRGPGGLAQSMIAAIRSLKSPSPPVGEGK